MHQTYKWHGSTVACLPPRVNDIPSCARTSKNQFTINMVTQNEGFLREEWKGSLITNARKR